MLHPLGLAAQIKSGAIMGFGLASSERHIYDPQNGLPGTVGLLQAKPPSYLDMPATMVVANAGQAEYLNAGKFSFQCLHQGRQAQRGRNFVRPQTSACLQRASTVGGKPLLAFG